MVRNITLSADEALIRKARERAAREQRSLNSVFRDWLARYAGRDEAASDFESLMKRLDHARSGRSFTREELNER